MMIGEQNKYEKRRIEDGKRRNEDGKREKHRIEDGKRRIEDGKRKIEDGKRRIEDEKRRAAMKELINTADIYYQSCSENVRKAAEKFFKDIDQDNDGNVKLHEFLEFMQQEGHANMRSKLFETLDTTRRGTLQFPEVLALFYIIQSGRPFCRGCDLFIPGMYFTCSKCYQRDDNDVIFLCPRCFRKKLYTHKESHGRDQFLDNYTLLAVERKQRITRSTHNNVQRTPSKVVASTSNAAKAIVPYVKPQHGGRVQGTSSKVVASSSNAAKAIVPYTKPQHGSGHKWKPKLEEFLLALKVAGPVAYCIANVCTIM